MEDFLRIMCECYGNELGNIGMKKSIKKKITPENEKYWEHVKRVAEEVGNWPIEKTMGVLNNPHRREERGERGVPRIVKIFPKILKIWET